MASNHGKILNTANCPVLWHYEVPHAKLKGTDWGRGENGEGNGTGNGRGRTAETEMDREGRKERQTGARRPTGIGREKATVGGERDGVPGVLQGRECQLDSALTISGTGATEECSRQSGEWPRPTWT